MKRMIFSKRSLALVLALMMTLSIVYVPAFATEGAEAPAVHECDFSGKGIPVPVDHDKGSSGYTYYECQVEGCDKVWIDPDSIVKPGVCYGEHEWKTVDAVEPTCTTTGNVEYKFCTVCGQLADKNEELVDDVKVFELAVIPHKFNEWSITTDYDCTDLYMQRECLMCELVQTETWDEAEHDYVALVDAESFLAPTCSVAGKVTFVCKAEHVLVDGTVIECSKEWVDVRINPTKQHYTTKHEYVAPTCTTAGSIEYYECDMCAKKFNVEHPFNPGQAQAVTTTTVIDALGHDMGEYTAVEGYVCGAENNMVSSCGRENCEHKEYQTRQHNYLADGEPTAVIENCQKTTTTKTKCEYCEDVQTETETVTYHTNVVTVPGKAATCKADGLTDGQKCNDCEATVTAQTVITAASVADSHKASYVPAITPIAATCTTAGKTAGQKCPQCDLVIVEPADIAAKGHSYNTTKIDATCQGVGYEIGGYCAACGDVIADKVIPVSQCVAKADNVLVSEANCKSPAVYKSVCKWCDATINANIPVGEKNATNHIGTFAVDAAASEVGACITNGFAYAACDACDIIIMIIPNGASSNDAEYEDAAYKDQPVTAWMTETEFNTTYPGKLTFTVTATGHTEPTEPTVDAATCTNQGLKTWACTDCGHVIKTEVIPATGHDQSLGYVTVVGQKPTCTDEGVAELRCKTCNELLGTQAVAALGHKKPTDYTVDKAPTCTETGIGRYYCENGCNTQIDADVVIPATGHTEDAGTTTAATCQTTGSVVYKCEDCDITLRTTVIPTVAHSYPESGATTTATCTTDGIKTYTCEYDCGTTYTEVDPATGHAYAETPDADSYAATCYATGLKKWTCTNSECAHVEEEVLPLINHTLVEVVYAMTCQSAGYTNLECQVENCGYKAKVAGSDVAIDATKAEAHSFVGYQSATTVASCDVAEGVYVKKCEHCDTTAFTDTVTYDATKGHGTLEVVNGELTYVSAYTDKNTSNATWTYVEHVSNKCQVGVVGGYICGICEGEEVIEEEFADKKVGSALEAAHNLTASAKVPSCVGLGEQGWTYHEYCQDCDYGHTPDETWEFIPCTSCVTTTVSAVAPTCTEVGYGSYSYNPCHATKAEIEALKAAVVVPATGHAGTLVNRTYAVTCEKAGFVYEVCTACNDYFKLVEYIAPLGHADATFDDAIYNAMLAKYGEGNFEDGRAVAVTCSADGKTAGKICATCLDIATYVAGEVIASVGHTNAADEHFFDGDSCKDVDADDDRYCVNCAQTIAVAHRYATATSENATCQNGQFEINICVDCNDQKDDDYIRGPWTEEEHKAAILATVPAITPATPTTYGKEVYTCPHCDRTITIEVPMAGGIEFELDYNVVYPVFEDGQIVGFEKSDRKDTANGTWIAVDVLVYGNEDFHFSQVDLSFTFNSGVVFFGSDMTTGIENFVVESVVRDGNTVKVSGGVNPDAEDAYVFVNTVGENAEGAVLTTVYFMVAADANVADASFAFASGNKVWLADATSLVVDITTHAAFSADVVEFSSVNLGDANDDGVINGVDLLAIKQLINGKLAVDYYVGLDLDKDGSVTVVDYEILKALVNVNDVFASELYEEIASR